jgi:hypothetical protein
MAVGKTYTVDSGLIVLASTSQTPLIASNGGTAFVADIEAIRVSVSSSGGTPSYPSNSIVNFLLARTTAAATTASAVVARPHNPTDVAAQTSFLAGTNVGAVTTPGVTLWSQNLPFTAGANWAEWVTPGAEWRTAASATAGVAVYVTCTSAGTNTAFQIELVFSE